MYPNSSVQHTNSTMVECTTTRDLAILPIDCIYKVYDIYWGLCSRYSYDGERLNTAIDVHGLPVNEPYNHVLDQFTEFTSDESFLVSMKMVIQTCLQ